MDPNEWIVKSHTIPASYIRGYARGVRNPRTDRLKLAVKQYIPKSSSPLSNNAATIIFCHGVGSTKESYEPFFGYLKKAGLEIRSVWAADIAWHGLLILELGQSYLLNESSIGDSPHWDDTARDIIHMINVFQEEMPPPLIAIGQSWGGYPIFQAALYHPRLFTAIVPMEPYLAGGNGGKTTSFSGGVTVLMARRKDNWKSLKDAKSAFARNPYFAAFDKEVFDKVMQHDFRQRPDGSVELLTPKAQEVATMVRENPSDKVNENDGADFESRKEFVNATEQHALKGFYRGEPALIMTKVKDIIPPVLYVWGVESILKATGFNRWLMENTGIAPGASGGEKKDMVASVYIEGSGHPMPLEKPRQTAEIMVPWIKKQIERWDNDLKASVKGKFWTKEVNPRWVETMSKI